MIDIKRWDTSASPGGDLVFIRVLAELVSGGFRQRISFKSLSYCIYKSLSVKNSFGIGTNVLSLGASVC